MKCTLYTSLPPRPRENCVSESLHSKAKNEKTSKEPDLLIRKVCGIHLHLYGEVALLVFHIQHKILATVSEDYTLRIFKRNGVRGAIQAALVATGKETKRLRAISATFLVYFVIALSLYRHQSLSGVLRTLTHPFRKVFPDLIPKPVTREDLCKRLNELTSAPLNHLFRALAALIAPQPSFYNYRTSAIDGVRFLVPNGHYGKNEEYFKRPKSGRGEGAFPRMLGVTLTDTATHLVRDVELGPCDGDERDGAAEIIKRLPGLHELILLDRGFAGFYLFWLCFRHGIKFECRISTIWKPRIVRVLGPGDYYVKINGRVPLPPEQQTKRKKTKPAFLILRMIVYTCGKGETIRLFTNLMNPDQIPALELAQLYHQRWECELAYDEIKNHLATVGKSQAQLVFRSESPDRVLQEAYGLFIAYNLVRQTMVEAAALHGVAPLDISFTESLREIELATPEIQQAHYEERPSLLAKLYENIAKHCLIDRPRRERVCERAVCVKMSNFKKKSRTPRPQPVYTVQDVRLHTAA